MVKLININFYYRIVFIVDNYVVNVKVYNILISIDEG